MQAHERVGRLEEQLRGAVRWEWGKLSWATERFAGASWRAVDPAATATRLRKLAIVAADAGNVQLRLNPLRIAFVRVATSDSQSPVGEMVFPTEMPAADLAGRVHAELKPLLLPLERAGIDVAQLLEATAARRDRLAAIREVLEWGAVLGALQTRREEPVLVVRDGLLRSIHWDGANFTQLRAAFEVAMEESGNHLVAVAKTVPGGVDLGNALLVGGVMDRRPRDAAVAFLEIPQSVEKALLPGSFVVGRRMGPLLLAFVHATGTFVPLEVARSDPADLEIAVASLFGPEAEFYPEPGSPIEVTVAHQRARISAFDRELIRAAFLDELRTEDARLANRAVAAEVLGSGGPLITEESL